MYLKDTRNVMPTYQLQLPYGYKTKGACLLFVCGALILFKHSLISNRSHSEFDSSAITNNAHLNARLFQ